MAKDTERTSRYTIEMTDVETSRSVMLIAPDLTAEDARTVAMQLARLAGAPDNVAACFVEQVAPKAKRKPKS